MANVVHCRLKISGPNMDFILNGLEREGMHYFIPRPKWTEEFKDEKPDGIPEWYIWSKDNWGCKWDITNVTREQSSITFDTANSAPIAFVKSLGSMFPEDDIELVWTSEDDLTVDYRLFRRDREWVIAEYGKENRLRDIYYV